MEEKIKGCPFCGHIPMVMIDGIGDSETKDMYKIYLGSSYTWNHDPDGQCAFFGTFGPWMKTREDAIKFWNKRYE